MSNSHRELGMYNLHSRFLFAQEYMNQTPKQLRYFYTVEVKGEGKKVTESEVSLEFTHRLVRSGKGHTRERKVEIS